MNTLFEISIQFYRNMLKFGKKITHVEIGEDGIIGPIFWDHFTIGSKITKRLLVIKGPFYIKLT